MIQKLIMKVDILFKICPLWTHLVSCQGNQASQDSFYLNRAIELALKARGQTSPNPCVGCVIVNKDLEIVGEGYHKRAGFPHAEVEALLMAGERARGGTAYVSLEPCNHFGLTPPCSDALIRCR